jgi:hypothetical protein
MLGGMETFNIQHGFVEALVRGFRSGFVEDETYHHLSQCETLEVSSSKGAYSWLSISSWPPSTED